MSGVPALPVPHRVHVIVNAEGGTVRAQGWSAPYRTPHRFIGYDAHSMGLMGFALRAAIGRIDGVRDFEQLDSPTLEIDMRASRDQVATDDEVTVRQSPLHHRSRPRALWIFAAPKAAASAV